MAQVLRQLLNSQAGRNFIGPNHQEGRSPGTVLVSLLYRNSITDTLDYLKMNK